LVLDIPDATIMPNKATKGDEFDARAMLARLIQNLPERT